MFLLSDYNYELPEEYIAQKPAERRDGSRLLFLNSKTGAVSHYNFLDLCDFLSSSDVLVINDTRVIPGRLFGKKDSGGKAEVLIMNYAEGLRRQTDRSIFICEALVKSSKSPKKGSFILFEKELKAEVLSAKEGICMLRFSCPGNFTDLLNEIGHVPLPPYIRRPDESDDKKSYQTVYALKNGAVAAPTAGLHFSQELLKAIRAKGIEIADITLHVGYGTFLPVRVEDIRKHTIHSEWFEISQDSADIINNAKAAGGKLIAVGTTCVRTLEYSSDRNGKIHSGSGECDLFIYPGYAFKVIDAMITNFHLPKSTLIMLVSAFAGRENVLSAYREAIYKGYRFYSYGDAMLMAS